MQAQSEMWLQIEKNGRMADGREVEGQAELTRQSAIGVAPW